MVNGDEFQIIFSEHSDIKSQIKEPTNALYFHMYSPMSLHMFRLYQNNKIRIRK
jgi:hypothetical protein